MAQVLTETLEDTMHPGMAVVVDTKTQGRVHVHLGPVWYLERQEFEIKPGDEVGIKGMCDKKDEKMDVIAYELTQWGLRASLCVMPRGAPIGRPGASADYQGLRRLALGLRYRRLFSKP